MKTLKIIILSFFIVVGGVSLAQTQQDEGSVSVKIQRSVNGETETFEGSYSNEEEMKNDPTYQQFMGEDDAQTFIFKFDEDMFDGFDINKFMDPRHFSFNFDFDDDEKSHHFAPKNHPKGSPHSHFRHHQRRIQEMESDFDQKIKAFEEKIKNLDLQLEEEILDDLKDIEELHMRMNRPKRIEKTSIQVNDNTEIFGKKGNVKNKLDFKSIEFNTLHNHLIIQFQVLENEKDLTVTITDKKGNAIYNRYFEKFGGVFKDRIDFKQYSDGDYLLDIRQGEKNYVKNIHISR